MLRPIMLVCCAAVLVMGGEADAAAKLPAAAQATLERLAKSQAKIDADAAKARSTERQKAIKDLERIQQTVTKTGDLDAALAVKASIEELRKADEIDVAELLGDARSAEKDPAKLAVGSWAAVKTNGNAATFELSADKTARALVGPVVFNGIWQIEKDRVVIMWGGVANRAERMAFDGPDRMKGDSFDAGPDGVTCTRIKK